MLQIFSDHGDHLLRGNGKWKREKNVVPLLSRSRKMDSGFVLNILGEELL
jgi:hypothetical protein